MAEIGLMASIVQIADTGLRLSIKLYTFGEIVSVADKSVISMSKDVSLTSSVLKELGRILDEESTSRICSETAVQTADGIVKECLSVFDEMEKVLVKKLPRLGNREGEKAKRASLLLEKLKWPYLQPKLELMRSNLEKLKSTLNLMLNVFAYARLKNDMTGSSATIAKQRTLIQDLAQSNNDYVKKFEQMKLSVSSDSPSSVNKEIDSLPMPNSNIRFHGTNSNPIAGRGNPHFLWKASKGLDTGVEEENLSNYSIRSYVQELSRHYQALKESLLDEVRAAEHQIPPDSRCRITEDIVRTHDREVGQMYSHWFNLSKPDESDMLDQSTEDAPIQSDCFKSQSNPAVAASSLSSIPKPHVHSAQCREYASFPLKRPLSPQPEHRLSQRRMANSLQQHGERYQTTSQRQQQAISSQNCNIENPSDFPTANQLPPHPATLHSPRSSQNSLPPSESSFTSPIVLPPLPGKSSRTAQISGSTQYPYQVPYPPYPHGPLTSPHYHYPISTKKRARRPAKPSPITTSASSTQWKNVDAPGSVRQPSLIRPTDAISPISETAPHNQQPAQYAFSNNNRTLRHPCTMSPVIPANSNPSAAAATWQTQQPSQQLLKEFVEFSNAIGTLPHKEPTHHELVPPSHLETHPTVNKTIDSSALSKPGALNPDAAKCHPSTGSSEKIVSCDPNVLTYQDIVDKLVALWTRPLPNTLPAASTTKNAAIS